MKNVLILYSGGADSTLLLLLAIELGYTPTCLPFDYGQTNLGELDYAKEMHRNILAERGSMNSTLLDPLSIQRAFDLSRGKLLNPEEGSPDGVHDMHVAGRNAVFVAVGLSVAESMDLDEVWIGCNYTSKINGFVDCDQDWILTMDKLGQTGYTRSIRVKAPLLGFGKDDVLRLLQRKGVDLGKVYVGYEAPKKES